MNIASIINELEQYAPTALQESYDNTGLITGNTQWECTGILCTLDVTEAVILEATTKNCNLIVAHHPIIFSGLKKITGKNYVEQTIIAAIKNDIAIYAIHTNLDNVLHGVNNRIADKIHLLNRKILAPKTQQLMKLYTFVPEAHADKVRQALFAAGAGNIGDYSEVSFNTSGTGTFIPGAAANPFSGNIGVKQFEAEIKIEVIFPSWLQQKLVKALWNAHPYEEVAYDIVSLANESSTYGSGLIGELPSEMEESAFLHLLKETFGLQLIKHTKFLHKPIKKVAVCGGAGSFLTKTAIAAEADVFITADIKYHEFFDAANKIVLADIGHWESEQFTIDLLFDILQAKFPTFALLKTEVRTNPVYYFS